MGVLVNSYIIFEHELKLFRLSNALALDEIAEARLKNMPWWTPQSTAVNKLRFEQASALLLKHQFRIYSSH